MTCCVSATRFFSVTCCVSCRCRYSARDPTDCVHVDGGGGVHVVSTVRKDIPQLHALLYPQVHGGCYLASSCYRTLFPRCSAFFRRVYILRGLFGNYKHHLIYGDTSSRILSVFTNSNTLVWC